MTSAVRTAASTSPDDLTAEDLNPRRSFVQRHETVILPLVALAVILAGWEIYGQVKGFNPLFFAHPSKIWGGLVELARGPLWGDLRTSATEFGLGLGLSLVAIPLGMVIGSIRRLRIALDPIINGLYSTPTLALTPLFVIWFGLGMASKVAIVAIMAFFPILITTVEGVRTVDPTLLRAVRSFGARGHRVYLDVILPAITPFLVGGLRLAIGRGIIAVVIGEFMGAVEGVGYRIRADASVFRTPRYLAGVFVLVVASALLNAALKRLERVLAPWRQAADGS